MNQFSDGVTTYVFSKHTSDTLRIALGFAARTAVPGAMMAPIDLTDAQLDALLNETIIAIANHGRPCSPHQEGSA